MLEEKTLTELRGIAQSLGIPDIFSKTRNILIQDIDLHNKALIPKAPDIQLPPYDVRLMTGTPGQLCDKQELLNLLKPFIQRGLKVDIDDEHWRYSFGKKSDMGTMRMPLRIALKKAQEILG